MGPLKQNRSYLIFLKLNPIHNLFSICFSKYYEENHFTTLITRFLSLRIEDYQFLTAYFYPALIKMVLT